MSADHRTVQQQDRYIQTVSALELRVRIYVDHLERWQWQASAEGGELFQHLIAQLTVAPVHDREPPGRHAQRPAAAAPCALSCPAM